MLEAGLVRTKSTTEILTKNVALYSIACVMYLVCGYYFMYGGGEGLLDNLFLKNIAFSGAENADGLVAQVLADSAEAGFDGGAVYSKASDFFFQVVFVATAMSIVSGAVAERMRLWSFLLFAVVMTGFIYPIEGAWTWGGKEVLSNLPGLEKFAFALEVDGVGFSDFAGSGIVHLAGAAAALAGVLLLGARRGKYGPGGRIYALPGSNLPLATLGTFILWLGWFGFNGGSVLKLSDVTNANAVAMVFLNTNAAAAAGAITALIFARLMFGKADLTMALNGALAGLVAITAEPSTPTPALASAFGAVAGIIVVYSIVALEKMRIDDPVGAISVHGVVGIFGLLIVPITNDGASYAAQAFGGAVIFIWVFFTSLIVWGIIKLIIGLRLSEEEEYEGADVSECGMEAYPEFTN